MHASTSTTRNGAESAVGFERIASAARIGTAITSRGGASVPPRTAGVARRSASTAASVPNAAIDSARWMTYVAADVVSG